LGIAWPHDHIGLLMIEIHSVRLLTNILFNKVAHILFWYSFFFWFQEFSGLLTFIIV
jgi:hypothetical protein